MSVPVWVSLRLAVAPVLLGLRAFLENRLAFSTTLHSGCDHASACEVSWFRDSHENPAVGSRILGLEAVKPLTRTLNPKR